MIAGRIARRLLDAPRTRPEEAALQPTLDALGGEVVRIRSRDGLRLAGRWLDAVEADGEWRPDPRDAIVLLHGWSGSVAPDVVEYGPTLRRTAGVLGLDLRGHGDSDASPTTFGLREVDDVGGAIAWLGERGIRRLALVGTSMGGVVAIASTVVLGDGRLASVDLEPDAARITSPAPRPAIAAIVAESVPAELPTVVANRMPGPGPVRRWVARRAFRAAAGILDGDPRATEPIRVLGLLEDLPVLLIHGAADRTVPASDAARLLRVAGPGATSWLVPGAEHSRARRADPAGWDERVGSILRAAFTADPDRQSTLGILASPTAEASGASDRPLPEEADHQA